MKKLILTLLYLIILFFVVRCGAQKEESPAESLYCCGNHDPNHCGSAGEIEELTKNNDCKNFSAEGEPEAPIEADTTEENFDSMDSTSIGGTNK